MGDVHIKVSIARKQPMLDAATGKSLWASLGKVFVCLDTNSCVSTAGLTLFSSSQLCRTALKAPTGTREIKLCTMRTFSDKNKFLDLGFFCFSFNHSLAQCLSSSCVRVNTKFSVAFWILNHCSSHDQYVMLCVKCCLWILLLFSRPQ